MTSHHLYRLCLGIVFFTPAVSTYGQSYIESPEVMRALAQYNASHKFAQDQLARDLSKAVKRSIKDKNLEGALSIQNYREAILSGAENPITRDFPKLRETLNGTRYHWGIGFKRTLPDCEYRFTESQATFSTHFGRRKTVQSYKTLGERELKVRGSRLLFSPDYKRFLVINPDFTLRTGGCRYPDVILKNLEGQSQLKSEFETGTKAGDNWSANGLSMKFRWCPAGNFEMGESKKQVTLTKGFWIGQFEVTQDEWRSIVGTQPWSGAKHTKVGSRFPATKMTRDQAIEFCRMLSRDEQKAGRIPETWEYTLPTEAQWEYACRAGTTTAFSFGDDPGKLSEHGWWGYYTRNGNARIEQYAHEVGLKDANPWGLFDMHGNAWEFVRDSYQTNLPGGVDPFVELDSPTPVYRGGSWYDDAPDCNSTHRDYRFGTAYNLGFRVALVPRR